ncbi:MAG: hypothetical protein HYR83_13600 [Planctomycetes bacterium]|nr:hypothetical protein [Planctomycetota bacterium]
MGPILMILERLIVTATEERSQHINKARAIHRLREAIALHVRTPIDLKNYAPSEVLRFCISPDGRLRVGRRDERYFPALSELLDVLAECGLRVSDTAKLLGTSTAQLVAFFENDPKLWERVNQMRAEAGKRLLR